MGYKKITTTVLVSVVSIGSMLLLKNKGNGLSNEALAGVEDNTDTIIESTQTFAGITQEEASRLAEKTYRGLKAVIKDGKLTYYYSSASGKTENIADFAFDAAGKIVVTAYSKMNANSPRQFGQALTELIKSKNNL